MIAPCCGSSALSPEEKASGHLGSFIREGINVRAEERTEGQTSFSWSLWHQPQSGRKLNDITLFLWNKPLKHEVWIYRDKNKSRIKTFSVTGEKLAGIIVFGFWLLRVQKHYFTRLFIWEVKNIFNILFFIHHTVLSCWQNILQLQKEEKNTRLKGCLSWRLDS